MGTGETKHIQFPDAFVDVPEINHNDIDDGKRGVRILCIDGGGMRGLIPLQILEKIETITGKKIVQSFDLVCGTSTGGIIALGICTKINIKFLSGIYIGAKDLVFNGSISTKSSNLVSEGHMYDNIGFKNVIEKLCKGKFIHDISYPKVFVTSCAAINEKDTKLHLFRSYQNEEPSNPVSVHDAALATSAAPFYFKGYTINNVKYQDGGLLANNPTELAIEEANTLWPGKKIDIVLSIGTGLHIENNKPANEGLMDFFNRLGRIIINSERIHEQVDKKVKNGEYKFKYFRLNPPELGDIPLDATEVAVLDVLRYKTNMYIENETDTISQIKNILH